MLYLHCKVKLDNVKYVSIINYVIKKIPDPRDQARYILLLNIIIKILL